MFLFFFCNILLCLCSLYGKIEPEKKRSQFVPAESDKLLFGRFWSSIREVYIQDTLDEIIAERRKEIELIKEHWRERILYFQQGPSKAFYDEIDQIIQSGRLERIHAGEGSAYFLFDRTESPRFVVKPIDEDLLCLNNCKYYGNPLNTVSMRVRMHIPLYRSHKTDVMAYEFAKEILDLPNITPKTVMSIVDSPIFFDLSDLLEGKEKEDFLYIGGKPDKEKLCSIQAFLSNASNMVEIVEIWLDADLPDEEIRSRFDQDDFEDANIFVWTTYDNDAHAGNFFLYEKNLNATGNPVYGIIKIDNGLTFPEKNGSLQNFLSFLPNANAKLSQRAKDKIASISIAAIKEKMHFYEMDECFEACETRIRILQQLAKKENLEIYDIDLRMRTLEVEAGEEVALSDLPREEFEQLVWKNSSEAHFFPNTSSSTNGLNFRREGHCHTGVVIVVKDEIDIQARGAACPTTRRPIGPIRITCEG